ncbi:MAG: trypsin-like peptidase domain-containing protein [Kamptonema sp. SIO4C4]|nr:trypsin-like peptidase domain-containing protein [Kamptonema sp. SIO4C4]
MRLEPHELDRRAVRVTGKERGSGFLLGKGIVITCNHVLRKHVVGDKVEVWRQGSGDPAAGNILGLDRDSDVALLRVDDEAWVAKSTVLLDGAPTLGDPIYSFTYSDKEPDGESVSLSVEGWSARPFLLKLKDGQVRPGMSGSPVLNLRTGLICGMLRKTRGRSSSLGGRAIPTQVIVENLLRFRGSLGLPGPTVKRLQLIDGGGATVRDGDLDWIFAMGDASYEETNRKIYEHRIQQISGWFKTGEDLLRAQFIGAYGPIALDRREAMGKWFHHDPRTMRFLAEGPETDAPRFGYTCVLPLRKHAYQRIRTAELREFEILPKDLLSPRTRCGRYLLIQSFGFVDPPSKLRLNEFRRGLAEHIGCFMSDSSRPIILAEIGTEQGARQCTHFGLAPFGVSADRRPLVEVDLGHLEGVGQPYRRRIEDLL